MQFSTTRKQMAVSRYPDELRELVRAYQHSSGSIDLMNRINHLTSHFEAMEMKITDIRLLVELAQDYAAMSEFLNHDVKIHPELQHT